MKKLSKSSSISLDFIRAAASQTVVIGHGISFCGIFKSYQPPHFPWVQNISVVVFFILSGFLISYSIAGKMQNPQYSYRHFFIDRFSRIYTAFVPAVALVLIIDLLSKYCFGALYNYDSAFNGLTLFANLLQLQDAPLLGMATSFGSARPFWTLAIEWWIYMFVGYVALYLWKKDNVERHELLYFFLLSIVPLNNLFGGRGNGLMMYWLLGTFTFLIWNSGYLSRFSVLKKTFHLIVVVFASALWVGIMVREYDLLFALGLAIALLLIVDLSSYISWGKTLSQYCQYAASFSFTLYLIHYSVFDFLVTGFSGRVNPYLLFCVGVLISNILAIKIGRPVEGRLTSYVKMNMYRWVDRTV